MKAKNSQIKFFFLSIYKDLTYLKWYHNILLFIFGSLMIIFSIVDFNAFIHPEWEIDILAWNNDEMLGKDYWRRVLMTLSGAASFTGAMTVVLTTFGKISCYFWGIINCILYGLFAFSYGYGGDAQLNIIFFLPMQFWGIYKWKDHIEEEDENTVQGRSLKIWGWTLSLLLSVGLFFAFYYEIPKFVEAIGSEYLFYDNQPARILDALTNALSIISQILCNNRFWEQWIFWIVVDVLQVAMYADIAGFGINFNILFMWALFLVNALCGLFVWARKEMRKKSKLNYIKKQSTEEIILSKSDGNKLYSKGLIIERFHPFTKKHLEMINEATEKCLKTYILLYEYSKEEMPGVEKRKIWIKEICGTENNIEVYIGNLHSFEISHIKTFLKEIFELSEVEMNFDILFSSEKNGRNFLNAYLGLSKKQILYEFKEVDDFEIILNKGKFYGKKEEFLENLVPFIKTYYIPRIIFLGPESCGKTTLAQKLAEFYQTEWVKEYGHEYCEEKLKANSQKAENGDDIFYDWTDDDFIHIANQQNKIELNLAIQANKFLICDTDSFATNIWYERYMNKRCFELEEIHKLHFNNVGVAFYFLFNPKDLPFVQDGTRDGENIRGWMFDLFKKRLYEEKKNFYVVEGDYLEIENSINKQINDLFC